MDSNIFTLSKLSDLSLSQQKSYISQFFVPIEKGKHIYIKENTFDIYTEENFFQSYVIRAI